MRRHPPPGMALHPVHIVHIVHPNLQRDNLTGLSHRDANSYSR